MKCVERVGKGINTHIPSVILFCVIYIYICIYKRKYIYQRKKKHISVAKVNFTGLTSYSGKGMGEDFCGIKHHFSRIHLICMLQVLFITVQVMCSKWRINFNTFYIQYIPLEIS